MSYVRYVLYFKDEDGVNVYLTSTTTLETTEVMDEAYQFTIYPDNKYSTIKIGGREVEWRVETNVLF